MRLERLISYLGEKLLSRPSHTRRSFSLSVSRVTSPRLLSFLPPFPPHPPLLCLLQQVAQTPPLLYLVLFGIKNIPNKIVQLHSFRSKDHFSRAAQELKQNPIFKEGFYVDPPAPSLTLSSPPPPPPTRPHPMPFFIIQILFLFSPSFNPLMSPQTQFTV